MKQFAKYIPGILIIFIGIAYVIMGFHNPFLGDDLGFYYSFAAQDDCWYALPRSMYRHWIWNNARMADMLTPIGVYVMSVGLRAISNGIIISLLFYLISKLSLGKLSKNPMLAIIIIALSAFTFRWDAIWMEFCATYNYAWGAAFALLALFLILKKSGKPGKWYWWLCIPFCFIAGAMHEAEGFPLAVGMILYCCLNKPAFTSQDLCGKLLILAFILGGFFTLSSPASYSRVGSMLQPESPISMLLSSAFFVLILTGCILYMIFANRILLKKLCKSPWILFASAAYISTAFMLLSQYGGRTGWYAQIFALIALSQFLLQLNPGIHLSNTLQNLIIIFLSIIIIFHYSTLVYWQCRLGDEAKEAINLYKKAPDGIVYMDYTNEPDLPWFLLRKTHGVPDEDDTYYRYRISKHYGHGYPFTILPSAARNLEWNNLNAPCKIGNRIISPSPIGNAHIDKIVDIFPRRMIYLDNTEYIETQFYINDNLYYLYSPVDRDPGEK